MLIPPPTGTPIYVAPEVLRQKYGLPADLWSAGVIAYEMLTARLPFEVLPVLHILPVLHCMHRYYLYYMMQALLTDVLTVLVLHGT